MSPSLRPAMHHASCHGSRHFVIELAGRVLQQLCQDKRRLLPGHNLSSYYSNIVLSAMICAIVLATTTMAQNTPDDYVNAHNTARAAVGVGTVSWNDTVEAYAQDYANQHIGDCHLVHSGGPYGENLFWGSAGADWTAQNAVDSWVSEKQYYDYDSNTCASGQVCGHYTQVVWAASTSIGCARVICDNNGGVFIICNYYPRGNYVGERPY